MIKRAAAACLGLAAVTAAGSLVAAMFSPKPVTTWRHALVMIPVWGAALLIIGGVLIAAVRYDRRQP